MSDTKLVQAVLDEERKQDGQSLWCGERAVAHFTSSKNIIAVNEERARQAALGHRALKALVDNYDEDDCPACNRDHDPCDFCAIVAELRGGK